jgi:hypothetical protein
LCVWLFINFQPPLTSKKVFCPSPFFSPTTRATFAQLLTRTLLLLHTTTHSSSFFLLHTHDSYYTLIFTSIYTTQKQTRQLRQRHQTPSQASFLSTRKCLEAFLGLFHLCISTSVSFISYLDESTAYPHQ